MGILTDSVYDSEDDVYPSDDEWESEVALNQGCSHVACRVRTRLHYGKQYGADPPTTTPSQARGIGTRPLDNTTKARVQICLDEIDCQAQPNALQTVLELAKAYRFRRFWKSCTGHVRQLIFGRPWDGAVVVLACGHNPYRCLTGLIKNSKPTSVLRHHVIVQGEITAGWIHA
jgi:hypothetical protein